MLARRRMAGRRVARAAVGTAVVAGTAGAVRHHQQKRWARQDAEDQQVAYQQAPPDEYYAADEPSSYEADPPPQGEDTITQLERLGALRDQGILTDAEFAAEKAKILGS